MVICSCSVITDDKIKEACEKTEVLTVSRVIQEIGYVPDCGTCVKHIASKVKDYKEKQNAK